MKKQGYGINVRVQPDDYKAAEIEKKARGGRITIGDIIHEWRLTAERLLLAE